MKHGIIWKNVIRATDEQIIRMPKGTKILDVDEQGNEPYMWVLVNPDETEIEDRHFRIFGTGQPFPIYEDSEYIGTVHTKIVVWHIFEVREANE